MAKSSKLCVMISSRCDDFFPTGAKTRLSDIRKDLKQEIEAVKIAGKGLFEVWINEETAPQGGAWSSWEVCIQAVKDCDILVVLDNGHAGWTNDAGDIGICHAELKTGHSIAPDKVRIIQIGDEKTRKDLKDPRHKRFQEEVSKLSRFRGGEVQTVDDLKQRVREAVYDGVVKLAQAGVAEASRGRFHSGAALDWSRLDFKKRQAEMIGVLRAALSARKGTIEDSGKLIIQIAGQEILTELHAIPAALSVGPAKELVGQPFLRDHLLETHLKAKRGGPLHIIACNKTATEAQAMKLLGYPDATVVSAPFGIFVADPVQMVQFAFIRDCRDESTTRHGVQRFLEWLKQTGEDSNVALRAGYRARIVRAIAACQEDKTQPSVGEVTAKAQAKKRASKGGER